MTAPSRCPSSPTLLSSGAHRLDSTPSVPEVSEAVDEVEVDQCRGRVAAGIRLGEVAGERGHLLTELGMAADGLAPLLHQVIEFGLFAAEGHPARRVQAVSACDAPPQLLRGMGRTKSGSSLDTFSLTRVSLRGGAASLQRESATAFACQLIGVAK